MNKKEEVERIFDRAKHEVERAIAEVQEEWDADGQRIEVPADLETQIDGLMTENANLSWDEAIRVIQGPPKESADSSEPLKT